jgi:hypothetical protein
MGPFGLTASEFPRNETMFVVQFQKALTAAVSERGGRKIDVIGFDMSFMASFEFFNAVRETAGIGLACEALEPSYGWDYKALTVVDSSGAVLPSHELGAMIADAYIKNEPVESPRTFSVVNMEALALFAEALDMLCDGLVSRLASGSTDTMEILGHVRMSPEADAFPSSVDLWGGPELTTSLIDLGGFLHKLEKLMPKAEEWTPERSALEEAIKIYKSSLMPTVVMTKEAAGSGYSGLSAFFPVASDGAAGAKMNRYESSLYGRNAEGSPLESATGWNKLVRAYLSFNAPATGASLQPPGGVKITEPAEVGSSGHSLSIHGEQAVQVTSSSLYYGRFPPHGDGNGGLSLAGRVMPQVISEPSGSVHFRVTIPAAQPQLFSVNGSRNVDVTLENSFPDADGEDGVKIARIQIIYFESQNCEHEGRDAFLEAYMTTTGSLPVSPWHIFVWGPMGWEPFFCNWHGKMTGHENKCRGSFRVVRLELDTRCADKGGSIHTHRSHDKGHCFVWSEKQSRAPLVLQSNFANPLGLIFVSETVLGNIFSSQWLCSGKGNKDSTLMCKLLAEPCKMGDRFTAEIRGASFVTVPSFFVAIFLVVS